MEEHEQLEISTDHGPYLDRIYTQGHYSWCNQDSDIHPDVPLPDLSHTKVRTSLVKQKPRIVASDPSGKITSEFRSDLRSTLGKVIQEEIKPFKKIASKTEQEFFKTFHEHHVAPKMLSVQNRNDGISQDLDTLSEEHDSGPVEGTLNDVSTTSILPTEQLSVSSPDAIEIEASLVTEHEERSESQHHRPVQHRCQRNISRTRKHKAPYSDTTLFKSLLDAQEITDCSRSTGSPGSKGMLESVLKDLSSLENVSGSSRKSRIA